MSENKVKVRVSFETWSVLPQSSIEDSFLVNFCFRIMTGNKNFINHSSFQQLLLELKAVSH